MLGRRYKNDGKTIIPLNDIQTRIKQQIELKIRQNIYKFESVPCCICNNEEFEKLSEKDRYGLYAPVVICKQCGLIQINPRMSQKSYDDFYKFEYRKLYIAESIPSENYFQEQYERGEAIFSYLSKAGVLKNASSNLLIFEVGCGAGGILQYFKEKGYQVQGCDLDKRYIEYGKENYDLDLFYSRLKYISFDKKPDIFIFCHVLEHLLFPKKELIYVKSLMDDESIVYIESPGIKYLIDTYEMNFLRYLQNAHSYHFSLTSLKNLLDITGFKLIKGDGTIKSISRKNSQRGFEIKLKNDYKEALLCLIRMEKSKKIFLCKKYFSKTINNIKNNFTNYENIRGSLSKIKTNLKFLLKRSLY